LVSVSLIVNFKPEDLSGAQMAFKVQRPGQGVSQTCSSYFDFRESKIEVVDCTAHFASSKDKGLAA
jgi:hypothetical protein